MASSLDWLLHKVYQPADAKGKCFVVLSSYASIYFPVRPRFVIGIPCLQSGHSSGLYVSTSRCKSAVHGTSLKLTLPPLRSTSMLTATGMPPCARTTSITSLIDPPVVTISSTIRHRSPGCNENPRRNVILPFSDRKSVV